MSQSVNTGSSSPTIATDQTDVVSPWADARRPRDESALRACPAEGCDHYYHDPGLLAVHLADAHPADEKWRAVVPSDPVEALKRYGRVHVASENASGKVVHLHEACPQFVTLKKSPEHPGELPLAAERICIYCVKWCTDDQGALVPREEVGA